MGSLTGPSPGFRHRGPLEYVRANSGEAAITSMLAERPDVDVLNLMVPGTDGWQVLEWIRSEPPLTGLLVVLLSARVWGGSANADTLSE